MASSLTEWVRKPIIYVGAVVFVLGVLVFVHEFGHYAVAKLFNVRVEAVRTQVRKGKMVRFRQKEGHQSDWKKAVVTLNTEDKIDFF